MNREELKAAVKKAYEQAYREGFTYACDTFLPALIGIVNDMKEPAKEIETFDGLEEEE